jgi:hypothetical protein
MVLWRQLRRVDPLRDSADPMSRFRFHYLVRVPVFLIVRVCVHVRVCLHINFSMALKNIYVRHGNYSICPLSRSL